jgi:predicted small lipoprotein YifL
MNRSMRAPLALLAAAAIAGCGGQGEPPATTATAPPAAKPQKQAKVRAPRHIHCPADASNCSSAVGRVIYVEAVDPDGDGDAHFVLASEDEITGPGIAVIDVEKELRPRRLPRIGDWVTAEGPVYRGSHGQRQIQAVKLRTRRVP